MILHFSDWVFLKNTDMEEYTLETLEELIRTTPALMIYFYNDNCAPCMALRPKVKQLMDAEFPKIKQEYINAAMHPEIASTYGIFSAPVILVFFDGQEVSRDSKYISIPEFSSKIGRYYTMFFS